MKHRQLAPIKFLFVALLESGTRNVLLGP